MASNEVSISESSNVRDSKVMRLRAFAYRRRKRPSKGSAATTELVIQRRMSDLCRTYIAHFQRIYTKPSI